MSNELNVLFIRSSAKSGHVPDLACVAQSRDERGFLMRIPRVHVDVPLRAGTTIGLPESACEHLLRVLRLSAGAPLVLCNGDGMDYRATLEATDKRAASARILEAQRNLAEAPLRLVLAQALARGEKMDWVIQKATELGVAAIAPIVTERTELRLDTERAGRRLAHWQGIATAASEQFGRARVPEILEPMALATYAAGVETDAIRLALDPDGGSLTQTLHAIAQTHPARIHLVVGPEGGLSQRDQAQLHTAGFIRVRLGPRILRTETAGLAAIASVLTLAGDLR
jgi:16S rRNA (uracil1498-N3)-methyltransferase